MNSTVIFDMDGNLFQTNLILQPALESTFGKLRQKEQWTGTTPIEKYQKIIEHLCIIILQDIIQNPILNREFTSHVLIEYL